MTQSTIDSEVAEILKTLCANVAEDVNRNHPNYDWRIKHRVEAAHAITNLVAQEANKAVAETVDKAITYIRSGNVAGSFSEGCDCEKCDKYEKKVRKALTADKEQAE